MNLLKAVRGKYNAQGCIQKFFQGEEQFAILCLNYPPWIKLCPMGGKSPPMAMSLLFTCDGCGIKCTESNFNYDI